MKIRFHFRKALAGFLAGLLAFSAYMPVSAAEENPGTEEMDTQAAQAHSGDDEVKYSTDGGTTWTEASLIDAIYACYTAQKSEIRLLRDIVLDGSNWSEGQILVFGHELLINGEGHTIKRGSNEIQKIGTVGYDGSVLTLTNITVDGGAVWNGNDPATRSNSGISLSGTAHLFAVDGNATLVLDSGTVLQNNDLGNTYQGGAVGVGTTSGGKLVMKPGAIIRNNTGSVGGGVYVGGNGVFVMEGGTMSGNYAVTGGGAVYVGDGAFTMKNGEISGNAAGNNGGGVTVQGNSSSSVFTMEGGTISGNRGKLGGGVTLIGAGDSFLMSGGSITGNKITTSGANGGGILVVAGTLSVSGVPVVNQNLDNNNTASNVCLRDSAVVTISGALGAGANIGVTKGLGDVTLGWTGQMGDSAKPEDYFFSDNSNYTVAKNSTTGEAELQEGTGAGNVEKDVEKGEGTPAVSLPMDTDTLANAALTESDKQQVAAGTNIKILLVVKDIGGTVPEDDKIMVESSLGDKYTVGQYLDVELIKEVNGSQTNITETPGMVQVTITIPDGMKGNNRTYAIMRVHNGAVDILEDKDANPDTITIETNRFSTYTLVYEESKGNESSGNNGGGTNESGGSGTSGASGGESSEAAGNNADNSNPAVVSTSKDVEPKTGDGFRTEIFATIAMIAGLSYLMLLFADKGRMTEKRKNELVSGLIQWGRKGGRSRKILALAMIVLLLIYYHSIGRQAPVELA